LKRPDITVVGLTGAILAVLYAVNQTWRDRQIELFRYYVHTHNDKFDSKPVHRYGLFRTPDFSNPNKDVHEQIHERKNMDCKTLDTDFENLREDTNCEAALAPRPLDLEQACAPQFAARGVEPVIPPNRTLSLTVKFSRVISQTPR
jgi:hypothetical protein